MLDNMPILEKVVLKESKDDQYFLAKFKAPPPDLFFLADDELAETDPDDAEYDVSPHPSCILLQNVTGSPLKTRAKASGYRTRRPLYLSSASEPETESDNLDENTTSLDPGMLQFIQGQIHESLMNAAKLMCQLP